MPVRSSMSQLIARVRLLIADSANIPQQFADQDIQDTLDDSRDDIRYEPAQIAPSIVNAASTNNQALVIFADYYSRYQWWEADVVVQGVNIGTGAAWIVLSPAGSDFIKGHFQFELTPFANGIAPGQYPPVFLTGKIYDVYAAAADLLEFWAASLAGAYDVTVDGQTLRRSQFAAAKLTMAARYRMRAKPRVAMMTRPDVSPDNNARRMRLLDSADSVKGW